MSSGYQPGRITPGKLAAFSKIVVVFSIQNITKYIYPGVENKKVNFNLQGSLNIPASMDACVRLTRKHFATKTQFAAPLPTRFVCTRERFLFSLQCILILCGGWLD